MRGNATPTTQAFWIDQGAAAPIPAIGIVVATLWILFVMVTPPDSGPTTLGVKVIATVHVPPGGSGKDEAQLSVSEKSSPPLTLSTVIESLVLFVRTTCWDALLVMIVWLPKLRDDGEALSRGGRTVTGTNI